MISETTLIIEREKEMEELNYLFKCPNHAANLNNMRLNNKGCDVTIRVDDMELRAHKLVLAANFQYFDTMFFNSFQEREQEVITMTGLTGTDLEAFITYAYTGEILLTENNALNLLEVANYLMQDDIKEACVKFLQYHLKVEEACRVYKFATDIECLSLKNVAKSIFSSNFENYSQLAEYLDFDGNHLNDILSDKKEEPAQLQKMLFEAIMKWIMHDANNRKNHVKELINCIDITKLKVEYLMNYLGEIAYRENGNGVIEDVMSSYHTSRIEKKKQRKVLMIIGDDMKAQPHFQFYNFSEKMWSPLQAISCTDENVNSNVAVLNDKLYYICGSSEKFRSGFHLAEFDPSTKRSKTLNVSSSILGWTSLCADDNFLYLCGGVSQDESRSEQVLRYDPQTDTLETLTPMPCKRSSAAAIFYQNYLHVWGGFDGKLKLCSFEKYDPDTKQWMYRTRYRHAPTILDGKLFSCGRYIDNSVEVYDPENNGWQPVASMNVPRNEFIAVAFEGKILAIGGDKDTTVEVYDPSKDHWDVSHELSSGLLIKNPRGGFISASCVVDDK